MAKKKVTKKVLVKKPVRKTRQPKSEVEQPTGDGVALIQCPHCESVFERTSELVAHWQKYPCERYITQPLPREFTMKMNRPLNLLPPSSAVQLERRAYAVVVRIRHETRTAIELRRSEYAVTYVPQMPHGLCVETLSVEEFDKLYVPIKDYPVGRAARLYVGFAQQMGATQDALAELEALVDITATEKSEAADKLYRNKAPVEKIMAEKKLKKGERPAKVERKHRESASSMFKNLIMEGKLTDEEIFQKVKGVFNLSDDKRSYVAWYRNNLKKTGHNPPPAKGGVKKKAKPAKAKPAKAKKAPAAKKSTKKSAAA